MRWSLLFIVGIFLSATTVRADEHVVTHTDIIPGASRSTLVVLLHGYTLNGKSLKHVKATIEGAEGLQGSDFLIPNMPLATFSMAPSYRITAELLLAIDKAWYARMKEGKPYQRIVMVGHSIGGLYARKLYVAGCGENSKAPFDDDLKRELRELGAAPLSRERPWVHAVDRLVLLAGMNRGWTISHHMSLPRAIFMKLGSGVGHVLSWLYGRPPVIFTVRRGSSFITELRLQWLAMREEVNRKHVGGASTVQLLGTVDDLVSPEDNIDLISGKDFIYLEVPQSGHRNVIDMGTEVDGNGTAAERQKALLAAAERRKALLDALGDLSKRKNDVGLVESPLPERKDVTDVVFVIHGIRDEGYWTRKIAYRAQRMGDRHSRVVATETSSYGYFPMLSFLRPGARQEKVEWLMDRYTDARARYPDARFHYVGHSNGTYLLAKALQDYPAVRFDHVVFAGSVVHRAYEWQKFVPKRVKSVLNFVATGDWVVAFFPKALQSIGVQDLGSAGHDGFNVASDQGPIQELPNYVVGYHSAALQEAMWDGIAEYVLTGEFKSPEGAEMAETQKWWVAGPAHVAPLLWIIIALLIGWGFHSLWRMQVREWRKTIYIVASCLLLWIILTMA